jgi:hypothetical protein
MGDDAVHTTGQVDVSVAPDGWSGRMRSASVERALEATYRRIAAELGNVGAQLRIVEQRLARIEAQPVSGGPQLRTADKTTALHGAGSHAVAQYQALEGLAGRLTDPQAQVAVAAEMIRLQQEAAGMSPAMQVMPRAGRGWASE